MHGQQGDKTGWSTFGGCRFGLEILIISEINSQGVPCIHGSCSEVYLEKAFDKTNLRPKKRLKVAKELGETSIVFLVHPTLSKEEMSEIADKAVSVFSKAASS